MGFEFKIAEKIEKFNFCLVAFNNNALHSVAVLCTIKIFVWDKQILSTIFTRQKGKSSFVNTQIC